MNSANWTIRELRPEDVDFVAAVHLAVMAQPKGSNSIPQQVQDLLEGEAAGGLRLRPVVGAYVQNALCIAVVGVESPGASNLILIPFELDSPVHLEGGLLALRHLLELCEICGISLSQVIGPEHPSNWDVILQQAGCIRLTDLVYMTRSISNEKDERSPGRDHRWVPYSPEAEPLFCEAIRRTYVQSMDCPELTNLRTVEQSLSSHRAVGVFDPATWFVLAVGDQPQGVLLLSRVRREPVMEIVYMGVSQVARGSGVADQLMGQALRVSAAKSASLMLAVDSRNAPAKHLYARWGFVEMARRSAWIASLCGDRR